MRTGRRARIFAGAVLAGAVVLSGCGGSDEDARSTALATIPATVLPSEVLGLAVTAEDSESLVKGVTNSYVDAVGLFSFRRDDLLQATLQVTHLSEDSDYRDTNFRRRVVTQILQAGAEVPEYRMKDRKVYLGSGSRQSVAVWFDGRYMLVLSAREDFDQPRALLRALTDMEIRL